MSQSMGVTHPPYLKGVRSSGHRCGACTRNTAKDSHSVAFITPKAQHHTHMARSPLMEALVACKGVPLPTSQQSHVAPKFMIPWLPGTPTDHVWDTVLVLSDGEYKTSADHLKKLLSDYLDHIFTDSSSQTPVFKHTYQKDILGQNKLRLDMSDISDLKTMTQLWGSTFPMGSNEALKRLMNFLCLRPDPSIKWMKSLRLLLTRSALPYKAYNVLQTLTFMGFKGSVHVRYDPSHAQTLASLFETFNPDLDSQTIGNVCLTNQYKIHEQSEHVDLTLWCHKPTTLPLRHDIREKTQHFLSITYSMHEDPAKAGSYSMHINDTHQITGHIPGLSTHVHLPSEDFHEKSRLPNEETKALKKALAYLAFGESTPSSTVSSTRI
jgi:hypothetical protein